jgi:hypothetical protein
MGFRDAVGMPRCPEYFRGPARAVLGRNLNRWTQASQVLRIERAQSCRDSRPDPDDPFFYAWPKHRDPKFAAKKQLGPPNGRRATWMSPTIRLRLFYRCD